MVGLSKRKQYFQAALYLFPAVFLIGVFVLYPVIGTIRMSFFAEWNIFQRTGEGFGLVNYVDVLTDELFFRAVTNTIYYTVWVVPVSIAISLLIATLLNSKLRGMKLLESIYFLPYITNVIAIGFAFGFIMNFDSGVLNFVLGWFGIDPIAWLTDPVWALPALIIFGVWGGLAFKIVVFIAALQGIDPQYYQAAKIDGASRFTTFRRITLPILSPIVAYITVISLIGSIKVYTEIVGLFGGTRSGAGPANSALTIVYYVYEKFYRSGEPTIAAAAAVLLFLFIFVVTVVQLAVNRRQLKV